MGRLRLFFRKLKYGYGAKIAEGICRQAKQKTQAILCVLTSIFDAPDEKIAAEKRAIRFNQWLLGTL